MVRFTSAKNDASDMDDSETECFRYSIFINLSFEHYISNMSLIRIFYMPSEIATEAKQSYFYLFYQLPPC